MSRPIRLFTNFQGPVRDVVQRKSEPAAACIIRARACRLAGDIDNAELWLNEAAACYRVMGIKNDSRTYAIEARATHWARHGGLPAEEEEGNA